MESGRIYRNLSSLQMKKIEMNANEKPEALVRGFGALWEGIKSNTYPIAFFILFLLWL